MLYSVFHKQCKFKVLLQQWLCKLFDIMALDICYLSLLSCKEGHLIRDSSWVSIQHFNANLEWKHLKSEV